MQVTGNEIAAALEKKHGKKPEIFIHSLEKIKQEMEAALQQGSPAAAIWSYRLGWATGRQTKLIGTDIWDVEGFPKQTLEGLLVDGQLEAYRVMPPQVLAALNASFH